MSKLSNHHDLLTTELLQKYRDGTLSPDEKTRVEALRDQNPFVADALEGVAIAPDGESFTTDVAVLRARLRKNTRKPRSFSTYTLRVAASLAMLVVASYLLYNYVSPGSTLPIAQEAVAPTPSADTERTPLPSSLSPVASLPPEALANLESTKKVETLLSLTLVQPPLVSPELSPQADEAFMSRAETEAPNEEFTLTESLSDIAAKRAIATAPRSKIRTQSSVSSTVSGQVLDEASGTPLPGVNVMVKGTQQGVVTDVEGNYQLELAQDSETLTFSSIGYTTQEKLVTAGQTANAVLEPDVQSLSEVVVVGYGSSAKKGDVATVTSAQPQSGMRSYKKYLRDNVRYPDTWQNGGKATVKVSFWVQPDGSLADFIVKRSAGAWYDREAIRLIREGSAWDAATQQGQPVAQQITVKVRFRR